MDNQAHVDFLFDITKEVKHFYETPVIFLTQNDYSDSIFNTLCTMRSALKLNESKEKIMDIIVDFHLAWLRAVKEVENFQNRIPTLPREKVYEAISYTIDAMCYRLKYYQRYMEKYLPDLSNEDHFKVDTDLEIVEDMHHELTKHLIERLKCFRNFSCDDEFIVKVNDAIEELLSWLDKIYDGLAIVLSKYLNYNIKELKSDLTKTLQQIIDDFKDSPSPVAKRILEEIKVKGKSLGCMIRCTAVHDLEISKVVEKVSILEDRITRLQMEPTSAAVMALTNKKQYLFNRLESLEKLKTTLKTLNKSTEVQIENVSESKLCVCEDFYQLRIFNHTLPSEERERLVTELCYLWDSAVFGVRVKSHKSIISILSAADLNEEFTDELGKYYIDGYSRKIYKIPDDETLYQLNENNKLVPLSDDGDHIYFYDECGRYFVDHNTRERIYKAHATASEYIMETSGKLIKVKEEIDGVAYCYDSFGRYYINDAGKHIYREADTLSEYENDGLGNLVRIRSRLDLFEPCPDDTHVTEDFIYLKKNVGKALRACIADVILHQPADPIKFLSNALNKYRQNLDLKEKRMQENEELNKEREIIAAEERAAAERAALEAALLNHGGSEASYDSNLAKYTSGLHPDELASTDASSK